MLDARLTAVAKAVPVCGTAADIGSDHGLLPLYLLENGVCGRVIVTDISAPSLQKAMDLFAERGRSSQAEFICCDGLSALEEVPDAVVIAGMGGLETIKILREAQRLPQFLVLQPMRNIPDVRRAVVDLGYRVESDRVVYSRGKYYSVLSLRTGSERLTELEEEFGRSDLESPSPEFFSYLEREREKAMRILNGAGREIGEWRRYLDRLEYVQLRCRAHAELGEKEDESQ